MARPESVTRRHLLGAGAALSLTGARAATPPAPEPFGYCLNAATIRGQNLPLVEQLQVAAKAGYGAYEPWLSDLRKYLEQGGTTRELKQRLADLGLAVPSAIGFARWIVDDPEQRAKGLAEAREDLRLLSEIGATGLAAPPAGANRPPALDPEAMAERYRALLELGDEFGVTPLLEVWGFSTNLGRLGDSTRVAMQTGHPRACLLPDVYHLYKGGSPFSGLGLLGPTAMPVFHLNDYPADPPRADIGDGHRVLPGDGVAPLPEILGTLERIGCRGWLSLELFNRELWQRPALETARLGLAKMRAAVAGRALSPPAGTSPRA